MNRQRILIVEDDRALARVLSDNLSFSGFDVDWVDDGAEVLNKVRSTSPDLVLLDLMLPGRDGFHLCGLIRQGGRTPVIMLTARDQKVDKLKGLELGADDYITKPFDFEELQARIPGGAAPRPAERHAHQHRRRRHRLRRVHRDARRPRPAAVAPRVRTCSGTGRARGPNRAAR